MGSHSVSWRNDTVTEEAVSLFSFWDRGVWEAVFIMVILLVFNTSLYAFRHKQLVSHVTHYHTSYIPLPEAIPLPKFTPYTDGESPEDLTKMEFCWIYCPSIYFSLSVAKYIGQKIYHFSHLKLHSSWYWAHLHWHSIIATIHRYFSHLPQLQCWTYKNTRLSSLPPLSPSQPPFHILPLRI